jgi:hypothetical protein
MTKNRTSLGTSRVSGWASCGVRSSTKPAGRVCGCTSRTGGTPGAVKTKLRLSERTFRCGQCGFTLDRDLNAARDLAALVGEVTGCAGGEVRRDSPMET